MFVICRVENFGYTLSTYYTFSTFEKISTRAARVITWKMDQGHAPTTGHLLRVQPTLTSNTDQSVKGAKQSANVISLDIEPILIIRLILLQGHSFSVPDFEMIFSRKNIHLGVKFDGERSNLDFTRRQGK